MFHIHLPLLNLAQTLEHDMHNQDSQSFQVINVPAYQGTHLQSCLDPVVLLLILLLPLPPLSLLYSVFNNVFQNFTV